MECAGKGNGTRCLGPPRRRCGRCGAVAYCSSSHQLFLFVMEFPLRFHTGRNIEKSERLEQQMKRLDLLNDFPFTFTQDATIQISEKQESRCSFLSKRGIHQVGMWICECCCTVSSVTSFSYSRFLPSLDSSLFSDDSLRLCKIKSLTLGGANENSVDILRSFWRIILFLLLLFLPCLMCSYCLLNHFTLYHAIQMTGFGSLTSEITKLRIHYLGTLSSLAFKSPCFGMRKSSFNLLSLESYIHSFLGFLSKLTLFDLQYRIIGWSYTSVFCELLLLVALSYKDGDKIDLHSYTHCIEQDCDCKYEKENSSCSIGTCMSSVVTLHLHRGYYHECFVDISKDSLPHLVIASNVGVVAYSSWLLTIELIEEINVPAVFSDYCEEACHLAACCIHCSVKSIQAANGGRRQCPASSLLFKLLPICYVK
ncbi:hypothetical protein REPUB_Repub04eG0168400 [Reevesia pubescens]